MTLKSKTWFAKFSKILSTHNSTDIQLARLAVLYEDLRIEVTCASTHDKIEPADYLGGDYRRLYFLRRSFATLEEFATAFHQLNMDRQFKTMLREWPRDHLKDWGKMIRFFTDNRERLNSVRNAVGGHFSNQAAQYAVKEVADLTAMIEIIATPSRTGAGVKFRLAGDLVANALHKDREEEDELIFVTELFRFGLEAFRQASHSMHLVALHCLVPRF